MTGMNPLEAWESLNAIEARAEKAERQVAAVEALAEKWEATRLLTHHARALRAALESPDPEVTP